MKTIIFILSLTVLFPEAYAVTGPHQFLKIREQIEKEILKMKQEGTESENLKDDYISLQDDMNNVLDDIRNAMKANIFVTKRAALKESGIQPFKNAQELLKKLHTHNNNPNKYLCAGDDPIKAFIEWFIRIVDQWNQERADLFYEKFKWKAYEDIK